MTAPVGRNVSQEQQQQAATAKRRPAVADLRNPYGDAPQRGETTGKTTKASEQVLKPKASS